MGVGIRHIGVWFGLWLMAGRLLAADPFSAPDMGLLRQRDFTQVLRYAFVLGERKLASDADGRKHMESSGLFFSQGLQLEKLQESIDLYFSKSGNPNAKLLPLIEKQLAATLDLDQAVIDWTYEFRATIAAEPLKVSALYSQALQNLSPSEPKTYEQVMRRLAAEVDRKLFELRYPVIHAFVPIEKRAGVFPLTCSEILSSNQLASLSSFEIHKLEFLCKKVLDRNSHRLWSPDWDRSWAGTRDLTAPLKGILWTDFQFGDQHPAFKLEGKSISASDLKRFAFEVDLFVEESFDSDDRFAFESAESQIRGEHWSSLGVKHFAFNRLSEVQRNLLAAKVFPDLTNKSARALLELHFFDLTEEERFQIAEEIYPTAEDLLKYLDHYSKLSAEKPAELLAFHEILVLDYFASRREKTPDLKSLTERSLMNGQKLPDLRLAREKKRRLLLEEYKKPTIVSRLSDYLQVELNPYDGYLNDEKMRFKDEWNRRLVLRDALKQIESLQMKFNEAKSDEEKEKIAGQIAIMILPMASDPDSPAVFAASFLSGLTPRTLSDLASVAKVGGCGFAFYLLSRFVGGKIALTVLGVLGIRDIYLTTERWMTAPTTEIRLNATEDFGTLSRDFISFGLGAGFAHRQVDFSQIARLRKMDRYSAQIEKFEERIKSNRQQIENLSTQIRKLDEDIAASTQVFGAESKSVKRLSDQKARIQFEQAQLQTGTAPAFQSSLEFYLKRLVIETARMASSLLLWIPRLIKTGGAEKELPTKSFFQRFKRSEYLGILQYEQAISRLRSLEEAEMTKAGQKQARPQSFWKRRAFDRAFARYKKSQEKIATSLARASDSFTAARNYWTANYRADLSEAEFTSLSRQTIEMLNPAIQSIEIAFREFGDHLSGSKDLSTLSRGSLKELGDLLRLQEMRHKLTPTEENLQRLEEVRNLFTMPLERAFEFRFERDNDYYAKRFFAENYLRLEKQLATLIELKAQIERTFPARELPKDKLIFEKLLELDLVKEANQDALRQLRPTWANSPF